MILQSILVYNIFIDPLELQSTFQGGDGMKKRGALLFGAGLIAGLTSSFGHKRNNHVTTTSLPLFYAGTWVFHDEQRSRDHELEISSELKLSIDHHLIPTTVELIDDTQLIYLDKFGYHITIKANEQRPVALIDEADEQTYPIIVPSFN